MAGELRMLVSAIKISAGCWRMGLLAHHIGMAARRFYPAPAIPDELSGIFRQMGDVASRIADDARLTLLTSDAPDAASLQVDEDTVDGLIRALSGRCKTTGPTAPKQRSTSPCSAATMKDSLITPWRSPNPRYSW